MQITKIKPTTAHYELIEGIKSLLISLRMKGDVYRDNSRIKIVNVRLDYLVYNIAPYENSDNWYIEEIEGVPYALNTMVTNIRSKVRRGRFLQYENWMDLNNGLNKICDDLNVSANISSCCYQIRRGTIHQIRRK